MLTIDKYHLFKRMQQTTKAVSSLPFTLSICHNSIIPETVFNVMLTIDKYHFQLSFQMPVY